LPLVELENTITIAISVKDRHASAAWYQEMLGFDLMYHADEAGWSEVQTKTAGVTIGFGEHTEPAPEFDGESDVVEGMVKTATFYDPDGNALMLAEDLTGG